MKKKNKKSNTDSPPLDDHSLRATHQLLGHRRRSHHLLCLPTRALPLHPTARHPALHRRPRRHLRLGPAHGRQRDGRGQRGQGRLIRAAGRLVLRAEQRARGVARQRAAAVRGRGPARVVGHADQRRAGGHFRPRCLRRSDLVAPRRRLSRCLHPHPRPLLLACPRPVPLVQRRLLQHQLADRQLLGRRDWRACVWPAHPLDVSHCFCPHSSRPGLVFPQAEHGGRGVEAVVGRTPAEGSCWRGHGQEEGGEAWGYCVLEVTVCILGGDDCGYSIVASIHPNTG